MQSKNSVLSASGDGRRIFSGGLFIPLVCLCLGIFMVACGTNGTTTTGSGSGNSTGSAPMKFAVVQCGTIHTTPRGIPTDTSAAKTAEDCFAQDYKQCQPAILNFDLLSVDSGVNRTFTIKNTNGQCSITDAAQHYVVPKKPGLAQVYTCSSLTQETEGLHFSSCGQDGDIVVPDTTSSVNS